MALLDILTYPDARLHKIAQPVAVVDEKIRQPVSYTHLTLPTNREV